MRVAHPVLSGVALIRMIDAFENQSKSMQANLSNCFQKIPAVQRRIRQLEREAVRAVEKRIRTTHRAEFALVS